jgi:hypothetical protein
MEDGSLNLGMMKLGFGGKVRWLLKLVDENETACCNAICRPVVCSALAVSLLFLKIIYIGLWPIYIHNSISF